MNFLATYLYISPDGTVPKGEEKRTIVHSGVFPSIDEVIEFIDEHFDGKETFLSEFVPEIKDAFKKGDQYDGDDNSAGQWFSIVRLSEHKLQLAMEV